MTVDSVDVAEVEVVPAEFVVSVADQATLEARVRDLDGNLLSDREVEWHSLDDDVVTIDPDGTVTGIGSGVAVVTASVAGVLGAAQATVRNRKPDGGPDDPSDPEDDDGPDEDEEEGGDDGDDDEDDDSADPPRAPSRLEAERRGPKRVDLKWRDRSDGEDRFEIQRRTSGGSWRLLSSTEANREAYRDQDVERKKAYRYRVRACNEGGCSRYTDPASVEAHPGGGGEHDEDEGDADGDEDEDDDEEGDDEGSGESSSPDRPRSA